MKLILTVFFLFQLLISFSQIKKKDLIGEWYTNKSCNNCKINDTLVFNSKFDSEKLENCEYTKWKISKKSFEITDVNLCTGKEIVSYKTKKFKIIKTDFGQLITYNINKIKIDSFRIIQKNDANLNEIKLVRFDKIAEHKLYHYVDSLIFKVLKYNPDSYEARNQYYEELVDSNVKIRTLDNKHSNPEPLIVINGYPLNNNDLLKELLLVETFTINYITRARATFLYGSRGVNGVIILQTSEKRFKKVRLKDITQTTKIQNK